MGLFRLCKQGNFLALQLRVIQSADVRMSVPKNSDFLSLFLNPIRAKTLRLFIIYAKELFAIPEIMKRTALSAKIVQSEITTLLKMGIIKEELGEGKNAREQKKNKRYSLDTRFKYATALASFIHEVSPDRFDDVEKALRGSGRLTAIVLSGVFTGDINRPADLIVVGDGVNEKRLESVVKSFEPRFGREIRYAVFSTPEFRYRLTIHDRLIRETLDFPHRLLLNKNNLI